MSNNSSTILTNSRLISHPGVLRMLPEFKKQLSDRMNRNIYTPDLPYLNSRNGHLLFVYGTLKDGFSRHWMLKSYKSRFVCAAISWQMYSLFYAPNLGFPVMMPTAGGSPIGNVVGQLYIVPPKVITVLDECEKNGDMYNRYKINLQLITNPTDKQFQQYSTCYAWAYIGNPKEWTQHIHARRMVAMLPSESHFLNFVQPRLLTP
jgi:gamma-glutamylcyclotransferase (GGCT)/AIG2-like uncharacterized protein YtfP